MPLSDYELRIARAIGMAMFPRDGIVDRDALDADVAGWVERYVDALPSDQALQVRGLLRAVDVGFGALSLAPRRRFVDASVDEQREFLDGFEQHASYTRRMAFEGIRTLLMMAWLGSPDVQQRVGIDLSEPWAPSHYGQSPALDPNTAPAPGAIDVDRYDADSQARGSASFDA